MLSRLPLLPGLAWTLLECQTCLLSGPAAGFEVWSRGLGGQPAEPAEPRPDQAHGSACCTCCLAAGAAGHSAQSPVHQAQTLCLNPESHEPLIPEGQALSWGSAPPPSFLPCLP